MNRLQEALKEVKRLRGVVWGLRQYVLLERLTLAELSEGFRFTNARRKKLIEAFDEETKRLCGE